MKIIQLLVFLPALLVCRNAFAENEWHWVDQEKNSIANNYPKSLTIPAAWGAYGNVLFMGVGGTKPSAYASNADGAAIIGYGVGRPDKIAAHVVLASLDMSAWKRYSAFFHLCKNVSKSGTAGIGVENIMLTKGGDSGKSIYVVYSDAVPVSLDTYEIDGHSKLYYTIGVGKGRFSDNSDVDINHWKHRHGTYVFGGVAYEVANAFNVIADWNGLNLNTGIATTLLGDSSVPIAIMLGVADLTRYSGDRVRFIAGIGTAIKL
jgi:hypothetical protein